MILGRFLTALSATLTFPLFDQRSELMQPLPQHPQSCIHCNQLKLIPAELLSNSTEFKLPN
jgi:hypothetical protein